MAGEFEDPLRMSFQAESFRSGSISFGRFETEELTWERRSSFSHNRYLEEVERCSKPGSVVEKKAYFEAHFKERGMLLPASFGCQSGRDFTDNEHSAHVDGDPKEASDEVTEDCNCNGFDEVVSGNDGEFCSGDVLELQTSRIGSSSHCAESEQSGECGITGSMTLLDSRVLSDESWVVQEDILAEEAHQTEVDESCLNNDMQEKAQTNGSFGDSAAGLNRSSRTIDPSPDLGTGQMNVDKKDAAVHQAPKMKATTESASTKSRSKFHVSESQPHMSVKGDASKVRGRIQTPREKERLKGPKNVKQPSESALPTKSSLLRTPKKVDTTSRNSRSTPKNKSEREEKFRKYVVSQSDGGKQIEARARPSGNRIQLSPTFINPVKKPNSATSNSKSGETAERRREFGNKLEQKMNAKEAEKNQIQVRAQENVEAETKKFRKSLNFKATPMPSFYPSGACGNKAAYSKSRPVKLQQKYIRHGNGMAAKSHMLPEMASEAIFAGGSSPATNQSELAIEQKKFESCKTPLTSNGVVPDVARNGCACSKMESGKVDDVSVERVPGNYVLTGIPKVEGKQKVGTRRNSKSVVN